MCSKPLSLPTMDVDKLVAFATTYCSSYVHAFAHTLTRPSVFFAPVAATEASHVLLPSGQATRRNINPELFSFAILSIIIGFGLQSVVPRGERLPIQVGVILILVVWLAFAALLHAGAIVLRGKGSFVETATVTLQILGVTYVVCNLVALLARLWTPLPQSSVRFGYSDFELLTYTILQAILLSFYAPLALRAVHRLEGCGLFIPVVVLWISLYLFLSRSFHTKTNVPLLPPKPPDVTTMGTDTRTRDPQEPPIPNSDPVVDRYHVVIRTTRARDGTLQPHPKHRWVVLPKRSGGSYHILLSIHSVSPDRVAGSYRVNKNQVRTFVGTRNARITRGFP